MPNQLTKEETIAWEAACDAFENNSVFAMNAEVYKPESGMAELAGQTIRLPYANQVNTSRGLDISGGVSDVSDITVPISLSESDIYNSSFDLSATERNVERRIRDNAVAAVRRISSDINTDIRDTVTDRGSLVGAETGSLTDYRHFAKASAICSEIEAKSFDKFMYLGPRTALGLANELGQRQTDNNRDRRAYEMSELPSVGQFRMYESNNMKQISGNSATGLTVAGANQDIDLIAYNSDGNYPAGASDDPRTQTLTVSANTLADSDAFTIAGVNRIGIDSKNDTGQPMTFRVISGGGSTAPVISPAIVASGPNQNVSAAPANGAAISVINTATAEPTVFTTRDAIKLFCSDLDYSQLIGSNEVMVSSYTTKGGLQVAMIRQGEINDLSVRYRFTTWCKPNVKDPLKCGILLPNQGAAL